jgi:hypothetical protein
MINALLMLTFCNIYLFLVDCYAYYAVYVVDQNL